MATQASAKAPSVEDVSLPISATPSIDEGKRKWYRSTLFNAFVIGSVGFLAPGLWNAMNDLGAGGALDPYLVNAANALVFGIMGFFCLFGGPIANRIGFGNTLFLGAVGYPIYSAGLYTNVSLTFTPLFDIPLSRLGIKHCLHDKLTFFRTATEMYGLSLSVPFAAVSVLVFFGFPKEQWLWAIPSPENEANT